MDSTLYESLVKLGTTNPELRPHIRPLLKVAAGLVMGQVTVPVYNTPRGIVVDGSVNVSPNNPKEFGAAIEKVVRKALTPHDLDSFVPLSDSDLRDIWHALQNWGMSGVKNSDVVFYVAAQTYKIVKGRK